jgi:hypothetical protein
VSIDDQADIYHWELVGDSPECILKLIECNDENLINHIWVICGLYDSKKKQYTKGGPKFGLDNRRKGSLAARLSCTWFFFVDNTQIEHRTKLYSIRVLPSYICGATSWYLAN